MAIVIAGRASLIVILVSESSRSKWFFKLGATQGNDLPPIRDNDSAAVVAAKRQIQELIEEWLSGANL